VPKVALIGQNYKATLPLVTL